MFHGGIERRYLVHTPVGWDGREPLPLVLEFHGGMGHAELQRTASRMTELADKHKFIEVAPDGTGRVGKFSLFGGRPVYLTLNAERCCG